MGQDVIEELRSYLEQTAAAVTPSPPPRDVFARRAVRVWRRPVLVGLAAAGAVAVVAVLLLIPGGRSWRQTEPSGWNAGTVPTAGDLAGDRAWVARASTTASELAGAPVRHVVFAGRLPVGAAAVMLLEDRGLDAFVSRSGSPDDLVEVNIWAAGKVASTPRSISVRLPLPDDQWAYVVVPLVPAEQVQVSGGLSFAADGSTVTKWSPASLRHGAAVGRLDDAAIHTSQVRLDGAAPEPFMVSVRQSLSDEDLSRLLSDLGSRSRPGAEVWDQDAAGWLVATLNGVVEISDITRLDRFVHARVPKGEPAKGQYSELVAAVARLRGGGSLQLAVFLSRDGTSILDSRVALAGRPVSDAAADRTPIVAVRDGGSPDTVWATVVQPGAAQVVIRDTGQPGCAGGDLASGKPGADGVITLTVRVPAGCRADPSTLSPPPSPGTRVPGYGRIVAVALDPDGREIGRSPISLTADLWPPGG